jgi:endonuclease/exonuclease/phosphatase (EEP) superfamily protein YafD
MPSDEPAEADPAAPYPPRGWCRTLGFIGVPCIAAGYVALALVLLYRPSPGDGMGPLETVLTWFSLMGATFLPHAGIALVVAIAVCVLAKARKTAIVGMPLLVMSLGPLVWSFAPPREPSAAAGRTMLVLSANLLGTSRSDVDLLAQIETHDPDVIVLQEVRDESAQRLIAALGDRYEHVAVPRPHLFGQAVFSRLPFSREASIVFPEDDRDLPQVMVWVEFEGRELCVWDIHLLPPTGRTLVRGQATLAHQMGPRLDHLASTGIGAVVAGDFNSPWRGQPLDALRSRGFVESHRAAGSGPGASWPARGLLALPPGIRVDHIACSPELVCVEAWVGDATASDHRPVFARIGWTASG